MKRWLVLELYGALAGFGSPQVDGRGIATPRPGLSMLTGLLANALGWSRQMRSAHEALQDRIVYGAARAPGVGERVLTDYQTVEIRRDDAAWRTDGVPGRRYSDRKTFDGPHQRWRQYHAEMEAIVVLRLDPAAASPTLDEMAAALERPARPLFLGRKCCIPSRRILRGVIEARDVTAALVEALGTSRDDWVATLAATAWPGPAPRVLETHERKNWRSGLHGGTSRVAEGPVGKLREEGP